MTHSDTLQTVESLVELLEAADVNVSNTDIHRSGRVTFDADVSLFDPEDLRRDDDGQIDPTGVGGGTEKGDL